MKNIIALDIGGTKIFAACFGMNGVILKSVQIPTQAKKGKKQVLKNIFYAINALKTSGITGIGVAWAGFLDIHNIVIKKAPNIKGFENVHLVNIIKTKFKTPVFIENDARLFALAEQRIGAAKGSKNVLGIILGTGVGSGLVLHNEIYSGHEGYAGEIGHTLVSLNHDQEIEDLFAGPGLQAFFKKSLNIGSMYTVEKKYRKNDKKVIKNLMKIKDLMAAWIYNLTLTFNPDTIVFGGGAGKHIIPLISKELKKTTEILLKQKGYPVKVDIRCSKMNNSGAYGAFIYTRDKLNNES